jgi:hypothetical protein
VVIIWPCLVVEWGVLPVWPLAWFGGPERWHAGGSTEKGGEARIAKSERIGAARARARSKERELEQVKVDMKRERSELDQVRGELAGSGCADD